MEYIFGKNTIVSFLDSSLLVEVYLQNGFDDNKVISKLKTNRIKYSFADKNYLDKLSNKGNHQGLVASIKEYSYSSLDEIINLNSKKNKYPFIVALDGIEDPHNVGAIIRTCEAFGVDGILLTKHSSCPINATVAKVSTGAINNILISQVTNLTQALKTLKEKGYWVYAAEAFNSTNYEDVKYNSATVLVVGSEGFGISRLVKEQADFNISIPMKGKVNSLNVSVATAILVNYISLHQ